MTEDSSIPGEVVTILNRARVIVALTGAGISVESGIPDFRSPGGRWDRFDPWVYAALPTFLSDPERSWELFRAVGNTLKGRSPNPAHLALASLEQEGILQAIITQNIDGLHQLAGSHQVIEMHGDHRHLECIHCGQLKPVEDRDFEGNTVPHCDRCGFPLKPNVVLFGEAVRCTPEAEEVLQSCDVLLVIGTSAQVYPVASFPDLAKARGSRIFEFNLEETPLTHTITDVFFKGKAGRSLPVIERLLVRSS